jgi:hypothetical protein
LKPERLDGKWTVRQLFNPLDTNRQTSSPAEMRVELFEQVQFSQFFVKTFG